MTALEPWRVLASRVLHEGRVRIVEDEVATADGRRFSFPWLACPGYVKVVPLTAGGSVVLVRQYRHAPRAVTLELPAGGIEPGEDPADAARRELAEEALLRCERLVPLGAHLTSPGRTDEVGRLYLALDCVHDPEAVPDEPTEQLHVPFAEAIAMVTDGRIIDATSALALLLARDHLAAPR